MATAPQKQETYEHIMHLFDLVENVITSIEHPKIKNRLAQLNMAENFIRRVSELVEIILVTYVEYANRGTAPTKEESKIIEKATREIFLEITTLATQINQLERAA